jgi:hypothetical protein
MFCLRPFKCLTVLFLIIAFAKAGNYVPPAEGPVAFRIDRIPLEVGMMIQLSDHLINMANANPGNTPEELRRAAQTLALAVALDPTNSTKKKTLEEYGENRSSSIDNERLKRSHRGVWNIISWLESPQAGADGQALAKCLSDIIAHADHGHPNAEKLRNSGEKGSWTGWVQDITAYRPTIKVPDDAPKTDPPPLTKKPQLVAAQVKTLLWDQSTDEESWVRSIQPIMMAAEKFEPDEENPSREFKIRFKNSSLGRVEAALKSALAAHHRELPDKLQVVIHGEQLDRSLDSGKGQAISAAAFVLASAAITGEEPDATVIGVVTNEGEYKLPSEFWHQMRDLQTASGGGRLILPSDATEHLLAVLVFENPDFFFKYDVVLADNVSELQRLASKTPSEVDAAIFAAFEEIRSKKGNTSTGFYLTNKFVRPRLIEIAGRAPWYASAKMLALQASGNRPTRLSKSILSCEIMIALEPVAKLVNRQAERPDNSYVRNVDSIYKISRKSIEDLERYVESTDRPLYEKARDLTTQARSFGRTCEKYRNHNYHDDGAFENFYVVEPVESGLRKLLATYNSISEELTRNSQP